MASATSREAVPSPPLRADSFHASHSSSARKSTRAADDSLAWFEGQQIDLSRSWGEAHACSISDTGNFCFRTEEEMDQFLNEPTAAGADEAVILATCSTKLRLWDLTSQSGAVLSLDLRALNISLSTYSFASRTSSYRVGACSSVFRDSGGAVYPGTTSAGASANSMSSGWNNRITSVYIS